MGEFWYQDTASFKVETRHLRWKARFMGQRKGRQRETEREGEEKEERNKELKPGVKKSNRFYMQLKRAIKIHMSTQVHHFVFLSSC